MNWTNIETDSVVEMIRNNPGMQASITDGMGAGRPGVKPPSGFFAAVLIRSMFIDADDAGGAATRQDYRDTFNVLNIDPDKVDWPQIARWQIEKHWPSSP